MTPAIILQLLLQYGPAVLPVLQQVATWISDKKETVTAEDIAVLINLGKTTSAQIYAEQGIALPPRTAS